MNTTHLIVDAWSVFYAGYRASQDVSELGNPCGGIVKIFNAVSELANQIRPNSIHLAWENIDPSSFRAEALPGYKAKDLVKGINRPYGEEEHEAYENLAWQISFCIEVFGLAGIRSYLVDDYEADDVILHLTQRIKTDLPGSRIVVLSSNDELYPYLSDGLFDLYRSRSQSNEPVHVKDLEEEYGFRMSNWHIAKAIVGDRPKGFDGVPGIGWKKIPLIPALLEPNATPEAACDSFALATTGKTPKWVSTLGTKESLGLVQRSVFVMQAHPLDHDASLSFDEQYRAPREIDMIAFGGELMREGLRNIKGRNIWENLICMGRYVDPANAPVVENHTQENEHA